MRSHKAFLATDYLATITVHTPRVTRHINKAQIFTLTDRPASVWKSSCHL